MDTAGIIAELESERERLSVAIEALKGRSSGRGSGKGRSMATNGRPGKRHMSAAARKKIGEAKRKWWREKKKK